MSSNDKQRRRFIWPSVVQTGENCSQGGGERHKLVTMASAGKVAKRIPLIKFPNRKAGASQGSSKAVNQAVGGGGSSQAMPSSTSGPPPVPSSGPAGTASSQPPRTKLTAAEIEAILLGGAAP